jgi:Tfp pilus assembly protein PilF
LLRRAVQTAPELAGPRHFLGRTLFLEGKYSEARDYLSQAVSSDPNVYDHHYWLGRSLEQGGQMGAARDEYKRALQLDGDSVDAKTHLVALEGK